MASPDRHIDQNAASAEKANQLVLDTIKRLQQKVSKALLVHETGLSVWQVEDTLSHLANAYPCKLTVSEKGVILYKFDLEHKVHKAKPLLQYIIDGSAFILTLLFKLWIVLMVYTFGVFYGGILLIAITALAKNGTPLLYYFYGLFISFRELILSTYYYIQARKRPTDFHSSKYNLIQIAFDLVFGQTTVTDKLEIEKKVLDFLEYHEYKITVAELALLSGWSLEKADHEMVKMMTHYRGEPKVTENGIIVYHFDKIQQEEKKLDSELQKKGIYNWIYFYDPIKKYTRHGKEIEMSFRIVVAIGFFFSILLTLFANPLAWDFWSVSNLFGWGFFNSFWSSYFSLAFCALYFAIPQFGKARLWRKNHERDKLNFRRAVYECIFENLPSLKEKRLADWQVPIVDKIRFELDGQTQSNNDGDIIYQFDRLKAEIDEIESLRTKKLNLKKETDFNLKDVQSGQSILKKDWLEKTRKSRFWGILWISMALLTLIIGFTNTSTFVMESAYVNLRQALKNPSETKHLDLSYADDTTILSYLPLFENLESVNLTYISDLTRVPTQLTQLPRLRKLIFEENRYVTDFSVLGELQQLEVLDLRGSYHIKDAENFPHLLRLTNLRNLGFGRINPSAEQIPALGALTNLDSLDLGYNNLDSFPRGISKIKSLRYLSLENNDIDSLHPELAALQKLENLNAYYNDFKYFQPVVLELPKLRILQLYVLANQLPKDWTNTSIKQIHIRRSDDYMLKDEDQTDDIILPKGARIFHESEERTMEKQLTSN